MFALFDAREHSFSQVYYFGIRRKDKKREGMIYYTQLSFT